MPSRTITVLAVGAKSSVELWFIIRDVVVICFVGGVRNILGASGHQSWPKLLVLVGNPCGLMRQFVSGLTGNFGISLYGKMCGSGVVVGTVIKTIY